jgi:uncharacterized membrane protein
MTSSEYINELKACLAGEVPAQVLQETIDYYSNYIIREVNDGKTEEQVIQELGPARLIAKSVIAAQSGAAKKEEAWQQEQRQKEKKEQRSFSFHSWYGKLLMILAAVLLVIVVIVGGILFLWIGWQLIPVIAVIVLVLMLVLIFANIGRGR